MSTRTPDAELIANIRSGGASKERAIGELIKYHTSFIFAVHRKLGISEEQAGDAFSDAIMAVARHIESGQFRGESKLSTYLYRIFFNKGVDLARKKTTDVIVSMDDSYIQIQDHNSDILKLLNLEDRMGKLRSHLAEIGEKCRQILLDWGYWGYSMTEIAERVGLAGADQAKRQKYKCLQKLMKQMAPIDDTI
ncbi:MAG: sigma-70 family RNA polymerase sigma factor [Bacteroidota bacterium]